jgi:rhodanese-related sulfurtransferase
MFFHSYKNRFLYTLLLTQSIIATENIALSNSHLSTGCQVPSLLKKDSSTFKIREEEASCGIKKPLKENPSFKITDTLTSIEVMHDSQKLTIQRTAKNPNHTCPPFCIQPMNIKGITNVGELEVLEFIKKLKERKSKLFIDVRLSKFYKEETIPGAINIPFTMLKENSKYQKEVLKLLGAKKNGKKWKFKHAPMLLIFANSEEEPEAVQAIKTLLKLSYPSNKILFYRGGVKSWKRLGLTLY